MSKRTSLRSRLRLESLETRETPSATVLMLLANHDFYYRDYSDPRQELERAGLRVEVAAADLTPCAPHWNTGQGADGGFVTPDLTVAEADAAHYAAIVIVGGWGASSYQYAFTG